MRFGAPLKTEKVLLLDIGSSRIIAACVTHAENTVPEITASSSYYIKSAEVFSASEYLREVSCGVSNVLNELLRKNAAKIEKIVVVLSSLLYSENLRSIHVSYDQEQLVTQELMDQLVLRESERLSSNPDNSILLDSLIMGVKLNGYPVENPYGKSTHTIDLKLYLSRVDKNVYSKIRDVLIAATHTDRISFHAATFVIWSAMRRLFPTLKSYNIITHGGEVTEAIKVTDTCIEELTSLPFGKNRFAREIAKRSGNSGRLSQSMLRLYFDDKLGSERERAAVTDSLLRVGEQWIDAWHKVLDIQHKSGRKALELFIIASDENLPIMQHYLEAYLDAMPQKPALHIITSKSLSTHVRHREGASQENYFILSALFSGTLHK